MQDKSQKAIEPIFPIQKPEHEAQIYGTRIRGIPVNWKRSRGIKELLRPTKLELIELLAVGEMVSKGYKGRF